MVRRLMTLTLLVTLSMLGMPLPASASGDESVGEASEGRVLTLNGHPLWEVLHDPGHWSAFSPLSAGRLNKRLLRDYRLTGVLYEGIADVAVAFLEQAGGEISGVLLDEEGQLLPGHGVQLRRGDERGIPGIPQAGPSAARVVSRTVSDSNAQFQFSDLLPGRYFVEAVVVRPPTRVTLTSRVLALREGTMAFSNVSLSVYEPEKPLSRNAKIGIDIVIGITVIAAFVVWAIQNAAPLRGWRPFG